MTNDRPHSILVVEDDADVITLLRTILEHEGYEVIVAEDGLDGLLKLQSGTPDLTVLDIMMPDVNGVRLVEQLLEEGDGELPMPIIVITGSPDGAATTRRMLGSDNVFEKPFDPALLVSRIRARLRGGPS